jgi:hypothetical protein
MKWPARDEALWSMLATHMAQLLGHQMCTNVADEIYGTHVVPERGPELVNVTPAQIEAVRIWRRCQASSLAKQLAEWMFRH